jgi:hypothetical protein
MTNTLASRDGQGMLSDWIRRPRRDGVILSPLITESSLEAFHPALFYPIQSG